MIYELEHFIIMKHEKGSNMLGGWIGSYSDIWRLNSGICRFVKEKDGVCLFVGYSGSIYKVNEKREGVTLLMTKIHDELLTVGFENVPLKAFEEEFISPLHW